MKQGLVMFWINSMDRLKSRQIHQHTPGNIFHSRFVLLIDIQVFLLGETDWLIKLDFKVSLSVFGSRQLMVAKMNGPVGA